MTLAGSSSVYRGMDRAFCVRMKSTLTKRGCHFKSSGYRVTLSKQFNSITICVYFNTNTYMIEFEVHTYVHAYTVKSIDGHVLSQNELNFYVLNMRIAFQYRLESNSMVFFVFFLHNDRSVTNFHRRARLRTTKVHFCVVIDFKSASLITKYVVCVLQLWFCFCYK